MHGETACTAETGTCSHQGSPGSVAPRSGERRRRRSCCSYSLKKVYSRHSSRVFSQARAEAALCYDGAIITTLYAMAQKGTAYLLGAETHWLW